jgi:hypothetical protein
MGDPMRPLKWVSKSWEKLACELNASGHDVSPNTVGRLLVDELEYSRQVHRKTLEGAGRPDRKFEHINAQVIAAQSGASPSSPSTPRRRSRLAISRTAVRITGPKATRWT